LIFEFDQTTLLPPIPRSGKVICIAGNYPSESQLKKPDYPIIFLKPSGGVIGDQADVLLPDIAQDVAYEVELAVVIGRRARNITEQEARNFLAGFTVANDLGDRVLEKRTSQWAIGKMFDTFTPMGPIMVTSDEFLNVGNLKMSTRVNGELVQSGSTSQMFFDISYLVSYLSTLTTLNPGDVILTGSPKFKDGEPNPIYRLRPGDVVQVEVEKLCSLTNPIKAESQENL
jgi:acylpyruvate hydrolase